MPDGWTYRGIEHGSFPEAQRPRRVAVLCRAGLLYCVYVARVAARAVRSRVCVQPGGGAGAASPPRGKLLQLTDCARCEHLGMCSPQTSSRPTSGSLCPLLICPSLPSWRGVAWRGGVPLYHRRYEASLWYGNVENFLAVIYETKPSRVLCAVCVC